LRYRRLSSLSESERKDTRAYILPPGWLRPPLDDSVSWIGSIGLRTAYVSGWCAMFDFTRRYGVDAQFPLSDHGDFDDVMDFIAACRLPRSPRAPRPARERFAAGRSAPPPPRLAGPPRSDGDRWPLVPGQDRGGQRDPDSAVRLDPLQSTIQREDRVARDCVRVSRRH